MKFDSNRSLGLALVFVTAVIWVASSFITESLVTETPGSSREKLPPFLLTYLATSLFTLYLPFIHLRQWLEECWEAHVRRKESKETLGSGLIRNESYTAATWPKSKPSHANGAFFHQPTMMAAVWASPLWFAAQYTFNMSLASTSVTSNTVLSSTSTVFTFLLSIMLLKEPFHWIKLLCCFAAVGGTALITLADGENAAPSSVWGDGLAVISAMLYAGYTVVLRKKMPGKEGHEHVALFFGYVGLLCTVCLAPMVVILLGSHTMNVGHLPTSVFVLVLLEGLLDYVLADYFWAQAVLWLGPTVATLSLSVQIPMAAVAESIIGAATWLGSVSSILMTLGGTCLILAGFLGINLPQYQQPEISQEDDGGGSELPKSEDGPSASRV